jgi:TIR domain
VTHGLDLIGARLDERHAALLWSATRHRRDRDGITSGSRAVPSRDPVFRRGRRGERQWVLRSPTDLRAAGVDATLDQWDLSAGQDVVAFMTDGISKADRVLLVCTSTYVKKADAGAGGVGYERLIVTGELVQTTDTKKFLPILRANASATKIPKFLGPRLYADFTVDAEYGAKLEQIVREIHGVPSLAKPPLDERAAQKLFVDTRIVRVTESLMFCANLYEHLGVTDEATMSVRVTHRGLAKRTLATASPNRMVMATTTNEDASEVESAGVSRSSAAAPRRQRRAGC